MCDLMQTEKYPFQCKFRIYTDPDFVITKPKWASITNIWDYVYPKIDKKVEFPGKCGM